LQLISVDDLINHKVLPFDLYSEKGKKIFAAGELLTPGKILQLKYIPALYIEEVEQNKINIPVDEDLLEILDELPDAREEAKSQEEEKRKEAEKPRFLRDYGNLPLLQKVQTEIKDKYKIMMDSFATEEGAKDVSVCLDIRDSIIEEVIPEVSRIFYKSQLKVYGDYNYSHGINVAMLSALLAHKMKFNEQAVKDITLAAMLHDIGKTEIPDSVINKTTLTNSELRLVQLHTKLGYNIIKNDLGLSEHIAKVALQHHEKPDGSGYPYGISGKLISMEAYIVSVCNEYDKLTSGKGEIRVKNSKEAVKYLLETGSKNFQTDVLYTFTYMTNYNDITPLQLDLYK